MCEDIARIVAIVQINPHGSWRQIAFDQASLERLEQRSIIGGWLG